MAKYERSFFNKTGRLGLLIIFLWTLVPALPTYAAPAAPTDTPTPIVLEDLNEWTLNEGLLYWANRCYGGEFRGPGYLRRKPANGGATRTLSTVEADVCYTFLNLTADSDGLYYYSMDGNGFYYRPVESPYDPPTLVHTTDLAPLAQSALALDGDYVYWIYDSFSGDDQVLRVRKDGTGGVETVVQSAPGPDDLAVINGGVYWLDDDGLWATNVSCGSLPCQKSQLVAARGTHLTYYNPNAFPIAYQIYWVTEADPVESIPSKINRDSCTWQITPPDPPSIECSNSTLYTASGGWTLGELATNGTHLFWSERDAITPDGRLRRMPIGGGAADDIAANLPYIDWRVFTDSGSVYFAEYADVNIGIYRLPFNASAIVRDLAADALEVTQGIQNMANDVPLVAHKPTFVRAYGRENSGPDAVSVEALLYGTRGGNPLPGSPVLAMNGTRSLATGGSYNRININDGWLFQLPENWSTAGTINLRLVVDPRRQYNDPNRANNERSGNFTFNGKAPVCTVFVPTRTHSPNYGRPTDNPNFWAMLDVAERLWPAYEIWPYRQDEDIAELQVCWWGPFPYPCFGPYELPDDTWKVLTSLNTRDFFSDDPDECDNRNAETHYIGMVHPDTNTNIDNGTVLGSAYRNDNVAWVKFAPHTPTASPSTPVWPDAGATLAHEMSHNLGRKHVDCGEGIENIDTGYPYPTDQIDNVGAANHYGFDSKTRTAIAPNGAKDLMSYCRPYWTSDYTWKAIYNRIGSMPVANMSRASQRLAPGDAVFVSGAVTPTANSGILDYAWVYPSGGLSTGMAHKWETVSVQSIEATGMTPQAVAAVSYTLRLRDAADAILATYPVSLSETLDDDAATEVFNFTLTFVDPGGVARVELLADEMLLDSRAPGNNAPAVAVTEPHGGETFTETLQLLWQASDPDGDELLYNVQYSPDNGATWRAVTANFPAPDPSSSVTLTLSTRGLPGSGPAQGRFRVAASDGYNTGMATSNGFTIPDHAPEAYIVAPTTLQGHPAGSPVTLRGGAMDAEDGGLGESALAWTVDGQTAGAGQENLANGLAPGIHTAMLTATDSMAHTANAERTFAVQPLKILAEEAPQLDGFCDDAPYADSVQLQLAPYNSGAGFVHLLLSDEHLWACFSGMALGTGGPGAFAGLRVDANYSRDNLAQSDDYGFFVGEDGGYFTYLGDGSGGFNAPGPGGLLAYVSAYTETWSAELRIEAGMLGGWDHVVGLSAGHYWVAAQGDDYVWPYASGWNNPDTWATTLLGRGPTIYLPLVLKGGSTR